VVQGVAFYAEEEAGQIECDVDGLDGVPAFETAVCSNDGGEKVGSVTFLCVLVVCVGGRYRPFLSVRRPLFCVYV
jgi:hypothetical protein